MRLPVEPLKPMPPAEDLYAIRRRPPISPVPRTGPRDFPPQIVPHPERQDSDDTLAEELAADFARAENGGNAPYSEHSPEGKTPEHIEQERLIDRRTYCRRIAQSPTILDTRSGEDRRHQVRREDDPHTVIDEEV